ncbi:unnamed protein product, partial [Prorocentrum cordatum]
LGSSLLGSNPEQAPLELPLRSLSPMSGPVPAAATPRRTRPNRSAAERRAQYRRAEGRAVGRLLDAFAALQAHRGVAPTRLCAALAAALQAPMASSQEEAGEAVKESPNQVLEGVQAAVASGSADRGIQAAVSPDGAAQPAAPPGPSGPLRGVASLGEGGGSVHAQAADAALSAARDATEVGRAAVQSRLVATESLSQSSQGPPFRRAATAGGLRQSPPVPRDGGAVRFSEDVLAGLNAMTAQHGQSPTSAPSLSSGPNNECPQQ